MKPPAGSSNSANRPCIILPISLLLFLKPLSCSAQCLLPNGPLLDELVNVLFGRSSWICLFPPEWVDFVLSTPGSAYVIAFIYWLRHPLLLCLLLPFLFVIFVYFTVLCVHLFRLRYWLAHQSVLFWSRFTTDINSPGRHLYLETLTDLLKRFVAAIWDAHGRIFHSYEIVGMEKLPLHGPIYIIYYHGTTPLDAYYFMCRHCIERGRFPVPVADRFVFRIPGLGRLTELVGAIEGSVDECVRRLTPGHRRPSSSADDREHSEGDVILLAPGGVREALFSDEFYTVMWEKRRGFAQVSILSGQPIYPMFTENIREAIRVVQFGKSWLRKLYELTRFPLAIYYGYFPVKLRTFIGDPIYPYENETADQLSHRVRLEMQNLIRQHQSTPGNLLCAILQRIPAFDRWLINRRHRHRRRHRRARRERRGSSSSSSSRTT